MMSDHIGANLFLYVLFAAAVVMAVIGYFVIAPLERRNHERKLALLQQKIKNHHTKIEEGTANPDASDTENSDGA